MSPRDAEPVPSRTGLLAGLATLSVSFLLYAVIAIVTSVNIPFEDDFDSIGMFVQHFAHLDSALSRIAWVLTAQHVQYKLILLQTVAASQYLLISHTNYRVLQLLGDVSMPTTVILLWKIFSRGARPVSQRIWLFVPVAFAVLAIRYSESVNWAMSGLQNMAVFPLAVATLYFATQSKRSSFLASAFFLVLAICASGSGFFLAFALLFLLLIERRFRDVAIAMGITFLMAAIYALHYHVYSVYQPISLSASVRSILVYPFAFLGNAAPSVAYAALLGVLLIAGFIFLVTRGWSRVCPASFGLALFCLITAAGVTAGRYRYGSAGALAGHYVMYSVLLIALEYIAVVRLFVPAFVPAFVPLRSPSSLSLAAAVILSFLFCLWADARGYRDLHARRLRLITHLILWERHPDHLVLVPDEGFAEQQPEWIGIREKFQQELQREIAIGLYVPPYSANDPLPVRTHSPSSRGIEDEGP